MTGSGKSNAIKVLLHGLADGSLVVVISRLLIRLLIRMRPCLHFASYVSPAIH